MQSGVEKRNNILVRLQKSGQVCSFVGIALWAGKGQIPGLVSAAMFLGNGVVYFKTNKRIYLPNTAVFTTMPGTFGDQASCPFGNISTHAANKRRARAFAKPISRSKAR